MLLLLSYFVLVCCPDIHFNPPSIPAAASMKSIRWLKASSSECLSCLVNFSRSRAEWKKPEGRRRESAFNRVGRRTGMPKQTLEMLVFGPTFFALVLDKQVWSCLAEKNRVTNSFCQPSMLHNTRWKSRSSLTDRCAVGGQPSIRYCQTNWAPKIRRFLLLGLSVWAWSWCVPMISVLLGLVGMPGSE